MWPTMSSELDIPVQESVRLCLGGYTWVFWPFVNNENLDFFLATSMVWNFTSFSNVRQCSALLFIDF